jgi:hypothetical protein
MSKRRRIEITMYRRVTIRHVPNRSESVPVTDDGPEEISPMPVKQEPVTNSDRMKKRSDSKAGYRGGGK